MFGIFALSFQQKLFKYGIITSMSLGAVGNFAIYASDDSSKKGSLVILEGRQQGKIPEGANLQQKVQSLTARTQEQSDRIKALREEIQSLKNKLHLTQLTAVSEEKGNFKQLYIALKQESAQNKETQKKLENIILQLKSDNEQENLKNQEAQRRIVSLTKAFDAQMQALNEIEERYQKELNELASSHQENSHYKLLYTTLEHELEQYKSTQAQLENLVQQLKAENETEQERVVQTETHAEALKAVLKDHMISYEHTQREYKNQLENLTFASEEKNKYQHLYSTMEQELAQNKEFQNKLELLIHQLQTENQIEKQQLIDLQQQIHALMSALDTQAISNISMKEAHQRQLNSKHEEIQDYKLLAATLEHELSQNKEAHGQIEKLLLEMQNEHHADKIELNESEAYLSSLLEILDLQTVSIENLESSYKEQISARDNEEHQKILAEQKEKISAYEEELNKYTDILTQLHSQLALNEKTLKARNQDLSLLYHDYRDSQEHFQQLYETLQTEHALSEIEKDQHQQQLDHHVQQNRTLLQDNKEKEYQIAQLQQFNDSRLNQGFDEDLLTHLYNEWETENGLALTSNYQDSNTINTLMDDLEALHRQYALMLKSDKEKEEKLEHSLTEVNEAKAKAHALQKNHDEIQQIYDQTVKLYNELYVDHKTSQKQLESLHKEMDDHKMNHLVEVDDLEMKIESLSHALKKAQERELKLHEELTDALANSESLKNLQENHHHLTQEMNHLKNVSMNDLETLSLNEDLLNQSWSEIEQHKKNQDELNHILQNVYNEKMSLTAQLQAIPLTKEEIHHLQSEHQELKRELEKLKSIHLQNLHTDALQDELMQLSQIELANYKSNDKEKEVIIDQLKREKKSQETELTEKNAEINRLNDQFQQMEEQIKLQFKEFAINLEEEKCRNFELQKELSEHNQIYHSKQQNMQVINEELERLKNELALKDENFLLQKIEMEDLSDRLKQINEEKSKLMLHMQIAEEKDNAVNQSSNEYHAKLNENIRELNEIIASKDMALASQESATQSILDRHATLEQNLQSLMAEKNALQETNLVQEAREKELRSVLEQNLAELKTHKDTLDQYQRNQQETLEIATKLRQTQNELQLLQERHQQEMLDLQNKQKNTEELIEKSQLTQSENQRLTSEINSLKEELEKFKERDIKITSVQLERLQEALQQMISEKTALQSQYQNQLITEKLLSEKLEETLKELEEYKVELEKRPL